MKKTNLFGCLLETFPPVISVFFIVGLTAIFISLHPELLCVAIFINAQIFGNWIQFFRHPSRIPSSTKNFPGYVHRYPSLTSTSDGSVSNEFESLRRKWIECDDCDMHVPSQSRHCSHCRRCIYGKDHHCYFLGSCVGFVNRRFFLVFCFYAALGCLLASCAVIKYLSRTRNPASWDIAYFFLPWTVILFLMSRGTLEEIACSSVINFGMGAFFFTTFLFIIGIWSVLTGKDFFRNANKLAESHESSEDENPPNRFSSVFGTCGILHFLIPFSPFRVPTVEYGYRRIITYNNDFILNGVVTHCETSPY